MALFVEKNFTKALKDNENFKKGEYKRALEETFLKMDEIMTERMTKTRLNANDRIDGDDYIDNFDAGCTANVVLITDKKIYCANSGDSRSVLCEGGNAVALSEDHKPENTGEKQRIEKAEGFVSFGRTNGVLSLSRAIGDFEYKGNTKLRAED